MIKTLQKYPLILYATGGILLIIALLINLGRINIFMAVDEATRHQSARSLDRKSVV